MAEIFSKACHQKGLEVDNLRKSEMLIISKYAHVHIKHRFVPSQLPLLPPSIMAKFVCAAKHRCPMPEAPIPQKFNEVGPKHICMNCRFELHRNICGS
jgi:hypothetical protein